MEKHHLAVKFEPVGDNSGKQPIHYAAAIRFPETEIFKLDFYCGHNLDFSETKNVFVNILLESLDLREENDGYEKWTAIKGIDPDEALSWLEWNNLTNILDNAIDCLGFDNFDSLAETLQNVDHGYFFEKLYGNGGEKAMAIFKKGNCMAFAQDINNFDPEGNLFEKALKIQDKDQFGEWLGDIARELASCGGMAGKDAEKAYNDFIMDGCMEPRKYKFIVNPY